MLFLTISRAPGARQRVSTIRVLCTRRLRLPSYFGEMRMSDIGNPFKNTFSSFNVDTIET